MIALSFAILFFFLSPLSSSIVATRHAARVDCLSPESAATVSKPPLASQLSPQDLTSHESAWREITREKGTVDTLWDEQSQREIGTQQSSSSSRSHYLTRLSATTQTCTQLDHTRFRPGGGAGERRGGGGWEIPVSQGQSPKTTTT